MTAPIPADADDALGRLDLEQLAADIEARRLTKGWVEGVALTLIAGVKRLREENTECWEIANAQGCDRAKQFLRAEVAEARVKELEMENERLNTGRFTAKDGAQWVRKDRRDEAEARASAAESALSAKTAELEKLRAVIGPAVEACAKAQQGDLSLSQVGAWAGTPLYEIWCGKTLDSFGEMVSEGVGRLDAEAIISAIQAIRQAALLKKEG